MTEELPATFWDGVAEFNSGQYYACHDTLESLWMEASDPPKSLYQGLLQIAVACYHLGNQNWSGAVTLLGEGIRRLQSYEPDFAELDITHLVHTSAELLTHLQQTGPEQVTAFSQWVQAAQESGLAPVHSLAIASLKLPQLRLKSGSIPGAFGGGQP